MLRDKDGEGSEWERQYLDDDDDDSSSGDEIAEALLSGQKVRLSTMGKTGPGGRRDRKARRRAAKGKSKAAVEEYSDDDTSSDDDDAMFTGRRGGWDNDDAIMGASKSRLYAAIENGDFEDIDLEDVLDDDFVMKPKRKGKQGPARTGGWFDDELQAQWSKDRAKKAGIKARRESERALAKELETSKLRKAKKNKGKKGALLSDSDDTEDELDIVQLDRKMRNFVLFDLDDDMLALPPMSKKMRVAVHLLSDAYGLRSDSQGKGAKRFPVVQRTKRSLGPGAPIDDRRVQAIIATAKGEYVARNVVWRGKQQGLIRALRAEARTSGGGRGPAPVNKGARGFVERNRDGHVVGQGADPLGETNIGFRLLARMGWTEGQQIGLQAGGITDPIAARIKTVSLDLLSALRVSKESHVKILCAQGKHGLGTGQPLSREQAALFANPPVDLGDW